MQLFLRINSVLATHQEETVEEFMESGVDDLVVSLYQMDLDRALFLLRSYLRIRLQKVIALQVSTYHT